MSERRTNNHAAASRSDEGEAGASGDEPGQPPDRARAGTHPTAERSGIGIEIDDRCRALSPAQRRWIGSRLEEAVRSAGGAGEVRVAIVGDAEMSRAHERHCNDASTTDVITFDLSGGAGGALDCDLLVCADEARRQASARSIAIERELLLYCLHGVLHCLGHTDKTDEGFAQMHAREDEILRAIGVGATFGAEERA